MCRQTYTVDSRSNRVGVRLLGEPLQRRRGDQRHVAIQHHHLGAIRHLAQCLLHGMPRAQPLPLLGPQQVGLVAECRAHLVATVAVDDVDRCRRKLARGRDHMREHRPPGDLLQHLGQRRAHALALARGKDDDVEGSGHGIACAEESRNSNGRGW